MRQGRAAVLILAGIVAAPIHTGVKAQSVAGTGMARGEVSAAIVTPLRVEVLRELSFGCLAVSGDGVATVSPETGKATVSGGVNAFTSGSECTAEPAAFLVRGEQNRSYRFAMADSAMATNRSGGPDELLVTDLSGLSEGRGSGGNSGLLDAVGEDRLLVGGSLQVPADTSPGRYVADVSVTVSYN